VALFLPQILVKLPTYLRCSCCNISICNSEPAVGTDKRCITCFRDKNFKLKTAEFGAENEEIFFKKKGIVLLYLH
jgi:hypothetical protein